MDQSFAKDWQCDTWPLNALRCAREYNREATRLSAEYGEKQRERRRSKASAKGEKAGGDAKGFR